MDKGDTMNKDSRVFIIEADLFVRRWIALLLARDWRCRVVGEAAQIDLACAALRRSAEAVNLVLIDTHALATQPVLAKQLEGLAHLPGSPRILLLSNTPQEVLLRSLPFANFSGCLLKEELRDSLGWAVACASPERWAVTPGIQSALEARRIFAPLSVLDGRRIIPGLTNGKLEFARQAILYSMDRGDLSDENILDDDWTYTKVSELYETLGVNDLLKGETDPVDLLGADFVRLPRFQAILKSALQTHQKKTRESLAFHILTRPEIHEVH